MCYDITNDGMKACKIGINNLYFHIDLTNSPALC